MNTANAANKRRPHSAGVAENGRVTGVEGDPHGVVSDVGEENTRQDPSAPVTTGPVRGYLKIESAVRAFNFGFRGKTVLDIGSSTGGFTEYALNRGAAKVIAVEKGTNQMKSPLRYDPRVELHEKTDIFNFRLRIDKQDRGGFGQDPRPRLCSDGRRPEEGVSGCLYPDIIVADVSFLSLTKILKYAKLHLARSDTDFLVMLKPQFEAAPSQLNRGVVKNEAIRRQIIKNYEAWLKQNGFLIVAKRDNELSGRHGNRERFYWLRLAI